MRAWIPICTESLSTLTSRFFQREVSVERWILGGREMWAKAARSDSPRLSRWPKRKDNPYYGLRAHLTERESAKLDRKPARTDLHQFYPYYGPSSATLYPRVTWRGA